MDEEDASVWPGMPFLLDMQHKARVMQNELRDYLCRNGIKFLEPGSPKVMAVEQSIEEIEDLKKLDQALKNNH